MDPKPAPQKVVTRFAPSPTGYFHAGSYRTALFSYIYARQHKGKFILRIEDTDKERSKKEYEDNIMDSLSWLGLEHDEFYRQSDRGAIYKKHIDKLIADGHAYISRETPKEPGDRTEVIRFKNPNKKVSFTDLIRGLIEFDTTELGDFVIAKSMEEPIFHLVNVIDDFEMGITHVIRGEDHISNTPRHILIYEALGAPIPSFAHIPLLLSADRAKLSKRNGAVPVSDYRRRGFLAESVVNYLALLGWHPSDDKEILSFEEILTGFSLDRVQKSGAVFDEDKLSWFNRQYILKLTDDAFAEHAQTFMPEWISVKSPLMKRLIPVLRDKISSMSEIAPLFAVGGELRFLENAPSCPPELLLWKKDPSPDKAAKHIAEARRLIADIDATHLSNDTTATAAAIKAAVWPYAEAEGRGDVLWPVRTALTGQERSPDPFISAALLGRDESLQRLDAALALLQAS